MGSFGAIPLSGFGQRLQGQQISGDEWQRQMQQRMQQAQAQQSRQGIQDGFGIASPAQPAQPVQPTPPQGGGSYLGASGSDPASAAARAGGFTSSPRGGWGGGGWGGGFGGGGGWLREGQGDPYAAMRQNQQRIFANPNGPQQVQNPSVGKQLTPAQAAVPSFVDQPGPRIQVNPNGPQQVQNPTVGAQQQPNAAMQAAIESMRRRQAQPRRTIPLS